MSDVISWSIFLVSCTQLSLLRIGSLSAMLKHVVGLWLGLGWPVSLSVELRLSLSVWSDLPMMLPFHLVAMRFSV